MPALCHPEWPWRREGLCISQLNPPLSPCGHRAEYTGRLGTQGLEVRSTEQSWACLSVNPLDTKILSSQGGYEGVWLSEGAPPESHNTATKNLCPLPRDYASWNLSVNLYTVNAPWLFSLLWCAGVPSVTSDNSHTLSRVPSPLWIMVSWRS